jgi:hypothetical protein
LGPVGEEYPPQAHGVSASRMNATINRNFFRDIDPPFFIRGDTSSLANERSNLIAIA